MAGQALDVVESTPSQVKLAVVGEGSAYKKQVQYIVTRTLEFNKTPKPVDAADAVVIAICQATSPKLRRSMDTAYPTADNA